MLNRKLFSNQKQVDALIQNQAGGYAHALDAESTLAQLAVTGCLNDAFYASAETQLNELLNACFATNPEFIAKAAIYSRQHGQMKDTPVILLAWLASFAGELCEKVFNRVIDNGSQLRRFVQVLRSGAVVRKSLGSRPKRLVQAWLEAAGDQSLISAMVGNAPSLADVIKMTHPKASSVERSALYAHIIGNSVELDKLPAQLQALEAFKLDASKPVPEVPFQLLTSMELTTQHWMSIAEKASYNMTRMNLNTFLRHGVFNDQRLTKRIAERLANASLIKKARVFPYQLLTTWQAATGVPGLIRDALRDAVDIAVANVPTFKGNVAVAVDVSGSMESPVTGYRQGSTTVTRCVDVAALVAAAVLTQNPEAVVLPFNDSVCNWTRPKDRSVLATATSLSRLLGGGTAVSAPLQKLVQMKEAPDVLIIVSDNQSWMDSRWNQNTATEAAWKKLKAINPNARLVCIDLQPYANTQAASRNDVLNVGGFADSVWDAIARFSAGVSGAKAWTAEIDAIVL
jgi:60 kDa SS-A/Ro ribonucleoprotein